jgi:hypothetical protein
MTDTPTFDDLTPPHDSVLQWIESAPVGVSLVESIAKSATRWGARHGYEQAQQEFPDPIHQGWPEPITNRPPTEADGDEEGIVQVMSSAYKGVWARTHWRMAGNRPWQHTPRWQPRPDPSLKEQALALLADDYRNGLTMDDVALIRRALEQAGEGQS